MEQMNFSLRWRSWIKGCLSLAIVSVLINGSPTTEFRMKRGIRQGYPLSPFLFLIVAKALSMMMKEATSNNIFRGCRLGESNLEVSHLQFADDTLILGD